MKETLNPASNMKEHKRRTFNFNYELQLSASVEEQKAKLRINLERAMEAYFAPQPKTVERPNEPQHY